MTTWESTPTLWQFIAMRANVRRIKRSSLATVHTWFQTTVRLIMHIAGFSCLTFAGFTWNIMAGLITAGVCCFAFSFLVAGTDAPQQPAPDPLMTRR